MTVRHAAVVLALAAACSRIEQEQEPLSVGDVTRFAERVQPVLDATCASLDCHGDGGRPMRLYSENGLRARDELRGAAITDDEIATNAISVVGVDPGADPIESHWAVTKPLAPDAGGIPHVGGVLWQTTDDPDFVALLDWLTGAGP